jgi:hypothetical protein
MKERVHVRENIIVDSTRREARNGELVPVPDIDKGVGKKSFLMWLRTSSFYFLSGLTETSEMRGREFISPGPSISSHPQLDKQSQIHKAQNA